MRTGALSSEAGKVVVGCSDAQALSETPTGPDSRGSFQQAGGKEQQYPGQQDKHLRLRQVLWLVSQHSAQEGAWNSDDALAREGRSVLPDPPERLGRTEPGEKGWEAASHFHFDGESQT